MNIPIWEGSSTFTTGSTPFGFYDNDVQFQQEADKVARFCATRLGYPLMDVELQSGSFYTAFEEAVTTYGNELYAFKIRDNQLTLVGSTRDNNLNTSLVTPNMDRIVKLSQMYGTEAGSGGNVDWKHSLLPISKSQQEYDLDAYFEDQGVTGSVEVKTIFFQDDPAVSQFHSPFVGTGFGFQGSGLSFGFGAGLGATDYIMMPLSYNLQSLQSIELHNQIRQSNHSFELHNNKLRIHPIPDSTGVLRIDYIETLERISGSIEDGSGVVTNVSNTPYNNPVYSEINSVGRQWIYEYALALAKEMLGLVRSKYSSLPIPNAEMTLNGGELLSQAATEKVALLDRLRQYFDETSNQALLERRNAESEARQQELNRVPWTIYVG